MLTTDVGLLLIQQTAVEHIQPLSSLLLRNSVIVKGTTVFPLKIMLVMILLDLKADHMTTTRFE